MNPIIVLWAHPRSMSTATERIMRERGDLWCAHEPFMYDYYVHRKAGRMPHFDAQPDHPVTYAEIRNMLLTRAEAGPVFFKDMAYYVLPYLLDDPEFAARLTHGFIIRDPVAALLSYHKLDPDFTLEEAGIEAQWRLYQGLRDMGHAPAVIAAEDVRRDARAMMAAFWAKIGLPDCAAAFEWQDTAPEDWQQVGSWHGTASKSRKIRPMTADEARKKQIEVNSLIKDAPHLGDYLCHHQPFYEKLKADALEA